MKTFIEELNKEEAKQIDQLRKAILNADTRVIEKPGKIMAADKALNYLEEGVFKYGLTKNKNHYSFHSMVMYVYPDIADFVKKGIPSVKVLKGCINFKTPSEFPLELFKEMMALSANKDFSGIIEHYKKK